MIFYAGADVIKARPGILLHQRVSCKPLCGILTQNKLIQLKQCNLTLEFELVSAADDVCYKDTDFQ